MDWHNARYGPSALMTSALRCAHATAASGAQRYVLPDPANPSESAAGSGAWAWARPDQAQVAALIRMLEATETRFAELRGLGPDWDSYGGVPPTSRAVAGARELLQRACRQFADAGESRLRPFAIAPTPDGGILVEWRPDDHLLSVVVTADGGLEYLAAQGPPGARQYSSAERVSFEQILVLLTQALCAAA
jgi:hypothetical protein